jgi:hypothetical protein
MTGMKDSTARLLSRLAVFGVIGVAATQAMLAGRNAPDLRQALVDFGGVPPAPTRFALSPLWLWGLPIGLVAGVASAWLTLAHRPRLRLAACAGVLVASLVATCFTYWAVALPIAMLHDLLRP